MAEAGRGELYPATTFSGMLDMGMCGRKVCIDCLRFL